MKLLPSINFNQRDPSIPLHYVVLHYTDLPSGQEALDRLCDPGSEVSAHYVIDEDGLVYKLVEEEYRAWHAGRSFWKGLHDLNSASIGIEMINPGHSCGYRSFPPLQIEALKDLLRDIMRRYHLGPDCLLAHSDIAPTRKQDPGELFPWRELAKEGFGLWPTPTQEDYAPPEENEERALLEKIGYDCPPNDEFRQIAALNAFHRRYHPENLMNDATPETLARLRALARVS